MKKISGVLFDLDGTLLHTVPDLVFALNKLRTEFNLEPLPFSVISPIANLGSKAMIKRALEIDENHEDFMSLREKFLQLYLNDIATSTEFFPEMETVLNYLDEQNIPWGIVTNKLTIHTQEILKLLKFSHRPKCVISGDTLTTYKPDPEPILHACKLLGVKPEECLFVGDAITDVQASKAAGTQSLVALYGYITEGENPLEWQADGYIEKPIDILKMFK